MKRVAYLHSRIHLFIYVRDSCSPGKGTFELYVNFQGLMFYGVRTAGL